MTLISKIFKSVNKFTFGNIIEISNSTVNPYIEVLKSGNKYILNAKHSNYSFGGLHKVFRKLFHLIKIKDINIKSVLILGFGAGSVANILQKELEIHCSIVGVEKDPKIIELANKYFGIGRLENIELYVNDAVDFLKENKKKYDLIIVDVYEDFNVPESCEDEEFIFGLKKCLMNGGMIIFNKLIYNQQSKVSAKELYNKFEKILGKTNIFRIKVKMVNWMLVYSESY